MHQGSPAARNTLDSARIPRASKLLICGLFQKGRVLAQDGGVSDSEVKRIRRFIREPYGMVLVTGPEHESGSSADAVGREVGVERVELLRQVVDHVPQQVSRR